MAFSTKQIRQLRARLKPTHVREREFDGKVLHYIEGWHAVSEANRIFGFEGWDRESLSSQCVWQKMVEGRFGVAYLTRVRITVRANGQTIIREGLGSGEAFGATLGQAHERAAKAAETDATKRALSTFGNSFGLSLYGERPERVPLPQGRANAASLSGYPHQGDAQTRSTPSGQAPQPQSGPTGSAFRVAPPLKATDRGGSRTVGYASPQTDALMIAPSNDNPLNETSGGTRMLPPVTAHILPPERHPVDKSALPIGEPRRLRSPEHLRIVARQSCLVCGRQPSQAHHLRYAQPRALSRKVSDEFVVPLCSFHHDEVHRTGNEFQWWRARGIDAMKAARALWAETRAFPGSAQPTFETEERDVGDPKGAQRPQTLATDTAEAASALTQTSAPP